jgi:mannose-6-phosphate isomerase-like protein (cupin superfamily)
MQSGTSFIITTNRGLHLPHRVSIFSLTFPKWHYPKWHYQYLLSFHRLCFQTTYFYEKVESKVSMAKNQMIDQITYHNQLLALIISCHFNEQGIHFFTPDDLSQQLAYMRHPIGKVIPPHVHNPVVREVQYTQEVLFIKRGKLRVDFYNNQQQYLESRVLEAGDTILLVTGGHGFEVIEEIEMLEVKQGPYVGEQDKTRFAGISTDQAKIIEVND